MSAESNGSSAYSQDIRPVIATGSQGGFGVYAFSAILMLGPVDKLIGPEASGGDMYEAEIAC